MRPQNEPVVIQQVRRNRLRQWIDDKFDGVASRFAASVGKSQPQIQDMLSGRKSFGERIARDLERRGQMGKGWLDAESGPVVADRAAATHSWSISPSAEEAEVGREWGKLEEPQRSCVREQILCLVAAQKRDARTKAKRQTAAQQVS